MSSPTPAIDAPVYVQVLVPLAIQTAVLLWRLGAFQQRVLNLEERVREMGAGLMTRDTFTAELRGLERELNGMKERLHRLEKG